MERPPEGVAIVARFVFVTWDGGGLTPPALGIAQGLGERGHTVVFAGYASQQARFQDAGISCGLVETKGQENIDVARKCDAATLWCENATLLTGATWRYLKVGQKPFKTLQPADFSDLLMLG
jgi:hypothetical protein